MMPKEFAVAKNPLARVSRKDSILLFKYIRNKSTARSKAFLQQLIDQKRNINGRYYPKASKEMVSLLEQAERNGEAKGLDPEKLFVKSAKANKIFRFYLPKSRFTHRGRLAKICNLEIEVEER